MSLAPGHLFEESEGMDMFGRIRVEEKGPGLEGEIVMLCYMDGYDG